MWYVHLFEVCVAVRDSSLSGIPDFILNEVFFIFNNVVGTQ